ncbi:MAG: flagellar M-ring protein FliF [Thermodesulfobacteria bacterium]|nr:flagellar M-ring protein FliF [Thermodesulfobacteriota bacterium]
MAMPDLRSLPSQLKEFWGKLDKKQKAVLIGGSVGITLILFFLLWYATRPNWGLLYRGLDEQTAGQIVEYLKNKHIPFKVGYGGSIYVPKDEVPELRIEIASKGIVGGTGPGFELFDKSQMGLTEFQQRIEYERALEGELARTIKGIRGVEWVRVHLALPKESVFIEEERPPKASVVIAMKRGYELTPTEVKGIINLVSGAVPKLSPQNVVIIDARTGKSIKLPSPEEEFTTTQLAYKRKVEEDLKEKIESMLTKALGYGKVIAQVSVDMSFDKEKILQESYDPKASAVVSEEIDVENKTSTSPFEGGIAGVKGALEQKFEATKPGASQGQKYFHQKIIRNYDVGKIVKNLEISPGSIKKISVAVLVDKDALGKNATAQLAWIESLVKSAIGYNPDRGDDVTVEAIEFAKPKVKKPGIMDYVVKLSQPIIILVGLILFFIFVVRPLLKSVAPKPAPAELEEIEEVPTKIEEKAEIEAEEEGPIPQEVALGIIQSQPEKAALLVKKWLLEESIEERKKALAEAGY